MQDYVKSKTFNCGLMPTFTRSALPITLSKFLKEHPKVDIKITEAYSGVLEEMVRSNKLEFAIVPSVKNPVGTKISWYTKSCHIRVTSSSNSIHGLNT